MATFGTLKTRIANKLNIPEADIPTLSKIGDAINQSIDFYEYKHLWFNEGVTDITLVVDNEVVPSIPSDFQYEWEHGGLVILENNLRFVLTKITHEDRANVNSEQTSRPRSYTARNDQLILYPIPSKALTLKLYYIKKYDDLVSDSESNDWTNNAERLIETKALADLYIDERHSTEMSNRYEQKVIQELRSLQRKDKRRLGTGRLRVQSLNYDNGRRDSSRRSNLFNQW